VFGRAFALTWLVRSFTHMELITATLYLNIEK
jgi:hypothetical protein